MAMCTVCSINCLYVVRLQCACNRHSIYHDHRSYNRRTTKHNTQSYTNAGRPVFLTRVTNLPAAATKGPPAPFSPQSGHDHSSHTGSHHSNPPHAPRGGCPSPSPRPSAAPRHTPDRGRGYAARARGARVPPERQIESKRSR